MEALSKPEVINYTKVPKQRAVAEKYKPFEELVQKCNERADPKQTTFQNNPR